MSIETAPSPADIPEHVTDPEEDPTVVNPSSSTGISPPIEQRDRSRRQQRSRSRERTPQRTPPYTSSQSGQQPQHVVHPPGEPQTQPLASQDTDGGSDAVEPHSRTSNRSTLLQSTENPQNQKGKKTKKEVEKPNDLPVVEKCKSMDSDEDDEKPQNEPGTASTSQPFVPVLPLNQGPAASSQGLAASANSDDENSEYIEEYSAGSQDSGRTLLYPDLYILTNDERWTVTSETHKYAAAAGSLCFVTTETGEQQDINNWTAVPSVQRSLCLKEATNDSSSTQVEVPKGVDSQTRDMLQRCMAICGKAAGAKGQEEISCTKKEASAQAVRGVC